MSIEHLSEYEIVKSRVLGGTIEEVRVTGSSYENTSKLLTLLQMTWSSPVFGNAYPFSNTHSQDQILHTAFKGIQEMHSLLVQWLKPILNEWMQPISTEAINEIVRQIAPKSTAFCSAIAAHEIKDAERLAQVGLSIALVYWIDHRMDRGDHAMEEAIHWWQNHSTAIGENKQIKLQPNANIQACLIGIHALERSIRTFSRPEDAEILIQHVMQEVLGREVRVCELSRLYHQYNPDVFWDMYAEELVIHSIRNVALVYVTAGIYAIHRSHDPLLPSLKHVLADQEVMNLMNSSAAAMIRVLDDFGDRQIDSGDHPEWGQFTLNIFNQPDSTLITTFLRTTGFKDTEMSQSLANAFLSGDQANGDYIVKAFVDFVRSEFSALSQEEYEANQLFLNIGKRVIEAGYVNALGDMELAA